MVLEKICILDLANTAMILHTAKSLLVHRLRKVDALRWRLTPSESLELADLFPGATVMDLANFRAEACFTAASTLLGEGDTLSSFFLDDSACLTTSDSI